MSHAKRLTVGFVGVVVSTAVRHLIATEFRGDTVARHKASKTFAPAIVWRIRQTHHPI